MLIRDYTAMYVALHDRVSDKSDETRRLLDALLQSDELVAFMKLERITALQPPVSDVITNRLKELRKSYSRVPIFKSIHTGATALRSGS